MKNILIKLVKLYQKTPGRFHNHCRFYPTCSNYMIDALEEYGALRGTFMGIKRILRCNPFNKNYGYDPVKRRNVK